MTKSNLEIWEKVRVVPEEAKKAIGGGRLKGMTDINPVWRLKTLTEQFGPCGIGWYVEVVKERLEEGTGGEVSAFTNILLFIKYGDAWSRGIPATGGSLYIAKESSGLRTNDEAFKMAYTDALSVACKALGIGADVYFEKDKSKYTTNDSSTKTDTAPKTTPPAAKTAPVTAPPQQPTADKQKLVWHIWQMRYPNAVEGNKGDADGFCYEIWKNELIAYNKLDPKIKKVEDLNIEQLKDMEQKMDVPEVLR